MLGIVQLGWTTEIRWFFPLGGDAWFIEGRSDTWSRKKPCEEKNSHLGIFCLDGESKIGYAMLRRMSICRNSSYSWYTLRMRLQGDRRNARAVLSFQRMSPWVMNFSCSDFSAIKSMKSTSRMRIAPVKIKINENCCITAVSFSESWLIT